MPEEQWPEGVAGVEAQDEGDVNDAPPAPAPIPAPSPNLLVIDSIRATITEGIGDLANGLLDEGNILLVRLTQVGGWPPSAEKTRELARIKRDWAALVNAKSLGGSIVAKEIALTAVYGAIGFAQAGVLGVLASLPPAPQQA